MPQRLEEFVSHLSSLYQVCPPGEPPKGDSGPCPGAFERAGGLGPILGVLAVAVVSVVFTFALTRRLKDPGRRFLALFAILYLMTGLVVITIANALQGTSLSDMASEPGIYLLHVLLWPGFIGSYLGVN